jgi:hypothetical protein
MISIDWIADKYGGKDNIPEDVLANAGGCGIL